MITELTKESRMADQYDRYLSELIHLEAETGIKLKGSPTMKVGFTEPEEGKIKHYSPVLSLKDTKSMDDLLHFLGEQEGILSWKLDGVSIVLYYSFGNLQRAVSRGDGLYGRDITRSVMFMRHVPMTIPIKNNVIIRGEGCMSLKDFDQIKKTKEGEKYSNPRNMASGLINSTKSSIILLRHMSFIAHSVILLEGYGRDIPTRYKQFGYLKNLGFKVVPHTKVLNFELNTEIEKYTRNVDNFEFPVDGLVLSLNDISHGDSLGSTAKYPKHSMAFKWPDEIAIATVTGMKWSVSGTGLITPVVIFEPVMLEGTEVRQANLHTLKIFEDLAIGIGDTIEVFKANKIIPEVRENLTRSKTEVPPEKCPVCGSDTIVVTGDRTCKLYCYHCRGKE